MFDQTTASKTLKRLVREDARVHLRSGPPRFEWEPLGNGTRVVTEGGETFVYSAQDLADMAEIVRHV